MKNLLLSLLALLCSATAMADDYLMLTKCCGAEETWPYGSYTAGTLEAATQFYADDLKDYVGGRITKIRFFAAWTYYYDSFDLWVKHNYDDEERLSCVTTTDITADLFKWHYYDLPTPVEITGEPLALGASFACNDMTFPLACCILDTPGGLFMRQPEGEWQDFSAYYNLCIEAVVEGISIESQTVELTAMTIPAHYCSLGERSEATVTMLNTGSDFSSVTLALDCGGTRVEQTFDEAVPHSSFFTAKMDFTAPDVVNANTNLSFSVTAIDGKPYEGEPLAMTFGTYDPAYDRNVVVEEATNTNNGYCVRGIVAMEYMHEKYPDTFIGIAVHSSSDPMGVAAYKSGDLGIEYVPGCAVDRLPRYAGESVSDEFFETYYRAERNRMTYADFAVEAEIREGNIVGRTKATFDFDNPSADLRMVYVVLEDGVTGYQQANSYSGGLNGSMDGFEWLPGVIDFLPFDNVARAICPSQFGEAGSLPASFAKGEECVHEFAYAVPANVQNRDNLSLVAMMTDGRSNEIVQAHKIRLDNTDAVGQVRAAAPVRAWATLSGATLPAAPSAPGLYISQGRKTVISRQ